MFTFRRRFNLGISTARSGAVRNRSTSQNDAGKMPARPSEETFIPVAVEASPPSDPPVGEARGAVLVVGEELAKLRRRRRRRLPGCRYRRAGVLRVDKRERCRPRDCFRANR